MILKSISIKNFRSIDHIDIGLGDISVFYGANDAGKSNILRALNLFFNNQTDYKTDFNFKNDFNIYKGIKKRADEIIIEIRLDVPKNYAHTPQQKEIIWRKVWRADGIYDAYSGYKFANGDDIPANSRLRIYLNRINFIYIPAIKDKIFFSDILGEVYSVLSQVAEEKLRISSSQFEAAIQSYMSELTVSIRELLNMDSLISLPGDLRAIFEDLEFKSNDNIPLARRGDGVKARHIPMILNFLHEKRNSLQTRGAIPQQQIWGFEEPENNVEMASCFQLANQFLDYSKSMQLLITTHSPVFYSMEELGSLHAVVHKYRVKQEGRFSTCGTESREIADADMGLMPLLAPHVTRLEKEIELHKQAVLTAQKAEFTSMPTLFVEGKSDASVIRHIASTFFPNTFARIKLVTPPDGAGGANYVKHQLIAWQYVQLHTIGASTKALGVLDKDDAGKVAKGEVENAISSMATKFVKAVHPRRPEANKKIEDKNFLLPIDLEAHYPDEVWAHAASKNWLEEKSGYPAYKGNSSSLIASLEALNEFEKLRVHKKFKLEQKQVAARYLIKMPNNFMIGKCKDLFSDVKSWLAYLTDQSLEQVT